MILTDNNFLVYAAKHYDNPQCLSTEEFEYDLKRFQYLKRLFNRYENTKELKERLILNHIIVLYNCFGLAATNMLFLKLKDHQHFLKPFILKLNYMPEYISYDDRKIPSSSISMDEHIISVLRGI